MSQSALSHSAEPVDMTGDESQLSEFNYRPVPVAAPVTMFLGVSASLGLFVEIALVLGLFGTLLGVICLFRIRQSNGELGGRWLAGIGSVLSFLFLVSGSSLHAYNYATEVPPGFQRVNFTNDVSKKGFVVENGVEKIHPEVTALSGKSIFIKGYMYPENVTEGLKSFLLVKDSDKCCFGGQPQLNDMIMVTLTDDMSIDYVEGLVSVAGVFEARPATGPAGLAPVFSLDATHFSKAKTSF